MTVARTAGFCWGVRRAVDLVITELKKGRKPFRVFGPLVHNPSVMDALADRGVSVCDDPAGLSEGTIFLRTHGVTTREREWLESLPVTVRDLTCPRVGRALGLAARKRSEGYRIVILGDPGHQEVIALRSCAGEDSVVISGPGDVPGLPDIERPFFLSQTTQSRGCFEDTLAALEERFPDIESENTICESTDRRQAELRELCPRADCVVVVGGRQSANTARLVSTAREGGLPVFHVEDHSELDGELLRGYRNILVTAGASTPNWSIRKVRERLLEIQGVRGSGRLRTLLRNLVFANIHIPPIALIVGAAGSLLTGGTGWRVCIVSASLLLFSFHTLTAVFEATVSRFASQKRQDFVLRNRWPLAICSLLAMTAAMVLSISQGIGWMAVTTLATLFFLVYSLPLLSSRGLLPEGLRRVPGSRDILFALGWAVLLALLPALTQTVSHSVPRMLIWPVSLFLLFLARSVFVDLQDLQGDALMGLDTIPLSLGARRSRLLLLFCAVVSALIQVLSVVLRLLPWEALGFLAAPLWLISGLVLLERSALPTELAVRMVADGSLLLAGLCPLALSIIA